MTDAVLERLDLLVLRLVVARDHTRLRPDSGITVQLVAAQLAELALAGELIDHDGLPVILSSAEVFGDALDPVRQRVNQLYGARWDQLFWRKGIDAGAVLARNTAELVETGVWWRAARSRPFRAARYAETEGAQLYGWAHRLDELLAEPPTAAEPSEPTEPAVREAILIALLALRFTKREQPEWMNRDWVAAISIRPAPTHTAVQRIVETADGIASIMRGGGLRGPAGFGM